jgi:hypothetical protein
MWVIDIRHWLNETHDGPAVPQLARASGAADVKLDIMARQI